jgi:uncharacterized membrane protein YphA (DoxX/SURF4 family)
MARIDAALGRGVDYRAVVLLRIAAGPLVIMHLQPFLADALGGVTYRDHVWVPYVTWLPQLPEPVYVAGLWAAAAAAALVSIGLLARPATWFVAGFLVYNLALSQTHYHHNRAFLTALMLGLALMPVGERVSLDALRGAPVRHGGAGWGPQWPLLVLRAQVASVYVASGLSKLLDPDWFGGVVTQLRVVRQAEAAVAGGVPEWLVDAASSAAFHAGFAKIAVVTELFIGVGLLAPRTRWAAVWVAMAFHMAIEVTADVQAFSLAAIAALVIWVQPAPPLRTVATSIIGWSRAVRALDWTGRFDLHPGDGLTVTDIDGVTYRGRAARWRIVRLFPATFFIAWPVSLLLRYRSAEGGPVELSSSSRS